MIFVRFSRQLVNKNSSSLENATAEIGFYDILELLSSECEFKSQTLMRESPPPVTQYLPIAERSRHKHSFEWA